MIKNLTTCFTQAYPSLKYLQSRRSMSHVPQSYTYRYPRPAVTVDTIIISEGKQEDNLQQPQVLLIQRKNPPCKDKWALPGGFVDENEPLYTAAQRELQEETSVDPSTVDLIQIGANFLSYFHPYFLIPQIPFEIMLDRNKMEQNQQKQEHKSSAWSVVFNICCIAIGLGVLSFPFAFRCAGLLGGLMLCGLCGFVTAYSMNIIIKHASIQGCNTFQDLVKCSLSNNFLRLYNYFLGCFLGLRL
eukprot:TRINITY_DN29281_c1_g1_i1.p1 TRINITY_DN29281_c1_g1~~TRINITY_DN29281_c1_g1_i1.p1  ORF type:complete len:264 (-),score=2.50 TRINITY_DN29281_c1_g1_i1:3-734(-)